MGATLDGIVDGIEAVFESKFMLPRSFSEEAAAAKYMSQLQHNMWVTQLRTSVLSIVTGGGKWVEITVPADPVYQTVLFAAERAFWRCVQTGERPRVFGAEAPRPRIEAVRIVDMGVSNAWAECAAAFRRTRDAHLEHDTAKSELKLLMPEDAKEVIGHGIRARQAKAGAAVDAGGGAVGLAEGLEEALLHLGPDAGAGVADLEAQRDPVVGGVGMGGSGERKRGKREDGFVHGRICYVARPALSTALRVPLAPLRLHPYLRPHVTRAVPRPTPDLAKRIRQMAAQYAFVMKDMTKTFPGAQKPVLSDINLQFYQGAKIGIVGPNGAGKSTLIKIMAGIDTDFTGEAWPGENITVGYLEQEPELDESKTVLENVKDGARGIADMVERFNAIGMEMGEEDADFDALSTEMSELQDKIDAVKSLIDAL